MAKRRLEQKMIRIIAAQVQLVSHAFTNAVIVRR
jgi:hypothetical protein